MIGVVVEMAEVHLRVKIMVQNSPIKIGSVNRVKMLISNEEPSVIGVSSLKINKIKTLIKKLSKTLSKTLSKMLSKKLSKMSSKMSNKIKS
jgi:hypothetical protein